ncbi:uncharacterized protein LOC130553809 isoform X2 [Triplophysa rosa]|uniref:uncharacterized protein LOC130553809 isoform X2 n=1 Tax=Triplophysa rosa TaxID=992332 RepID=UPI0025462BAC|nr:uncharacterized protein LOC130553809 isoform X2 [Triplophysa rosa]
MQISRFLSEVKVTYLSAVSRVISLLHLWNWSVVTLPQQRVRDLYKMHKRRGLTLVTMMLSQMTATAAPAAPTPTGTSQFKLLLPHRKVPKTFLKPELQALHNLS